MLNTRCSSCLVQNQIALVKTQIRKKRTEKEEVKIPTSYYAIPNTL